MHLFIVEKLDVNLIKVDVARGDLCCCQGKTFSVNQIDRLLTRDDDCMALSSCYCNAMASRYMFKVEYAENRFCSFFVSLTNLNDYSFVKLTNDIKVHVRALQVTTPNTIRIRFRDEDGDYVNLPYGDHEMFLEMFKSGKLANERDYTKIHLKVSELDSPMGIATHVVKKAQSDSDVLQIKPQEQTSNVDRPKNPSISRLVVVDDDFDSNVAISKTKAGEKKNMEILPRQHKASRSLDSHFYKVSDNLANQDEFDETVNPNPSPLQRYISKLEENVENQRRKVSLIQNNLYSVDVKLEQAKSKNQVGKGQMCGNCHSRLGHTARNCSLDKCTDIFSCGIEKFHQNQINRSKLNQELKREESSLQKLKTELDNRKSAIRSLQNAPANKIEQRLLAENERDYVTGNLKNWSLLRKHVHLIEGYCKRNFHGNIPPKESVTNILRMAEEDSSDDDNETLKHAKRRRTHENPSKSVLESYGVEFPGRCVSSSSKSCNTYTTGCIVSNDGVRRCEPTTVEEEEAQLEIALQASSFEVPTLNVQPGPEKIKNVQLENKPVQNLNENDAVNALMSLYNSNAC